MNEMLSFFPDNVVELKSWQRHSPPSVHYSQESMDAASLIVPKRGPLQERVFAAIKASPHGLTDQEIAKVTGLDPNTTRPRRIELTNARSIIQAGTRPTQAGRLAVVWVVNRD